MNASRLLFRRVTATVLAMKSLANRASPTSAIISVVDFSSKRTAKRSFAAQARKLSRNVSTCENLIEESIKKLMTMNRDEAQDDTKPISNEELEIRLHYFKVGT